MSGSGRLRVTERQKTERLVKRLIPSAVNLELKRICS